METKEQKMTTIKGQSNEYERQGERLREEQRVAKLQSQLETNEQEMTTIKDKSNEYQRQGERLRE